MRDFDPCPHPPIDVRLSYAELIEAGLTATLRDVDNLKKGVSGRYGAPGVGEEGADKINILGVQAEKAVAKALNLYWSGSVGNHAARDVGGLIDVRARSEDWHDLPIHPKDVDDVPYVHVFNDAPCFRLVGWIFAAEGKKPGYWGDPSRKNRPAFWVPQIVLRPMSDLVEWVRERWP